MSEVKKDLINTLENSEKPLYMRKIAEKSGYSRKTVEKYMPLLAAEDKVECVEKIGRAKLYDIKNNGR